MNTSRHLQQRVEFLYRCKSSEPAGYAHSPTSMRHFQRIHHNIISDQIKHRIEAFVRKPLRRFRTFQHNLVNAKVFQYCSLTKSLVVAVTLAPALIAILTAACPREDVPPLIRSFWPSFSSKFRNKADQAVAYDSGIAASSSQLKSDSIETTLPTHTRVYSA
jgi:hypothetical protein